MSNHYSVSFFIPLTNLPLLPLSTPFGIEFILRTLPD